MGAQIQAYLTAAAINLKRLAAFVADSLGTILKIIGEQITSSLEADAAAAAALVAAS